MGGQRILLVEGKDDEHVIKNLCGARELPQLVFHNKEGFESLIESLPVQLKSSGPNDDTVGVVVDADEDAGRRWEDLRMCLTRAGYSRVPRDPLRDGMVLDAETGTALLPRVGVWMMPDNANSGQLENFLEFLIPSEHRRLAVHVDQSIESIPGEFMFFAPNKKAKAKIHTWLAWQRDPGKPLGQAISARYLDADVPQVDVFVAWIKRLFQF